MSIKRNEHCLVCGSSELVPILDLGPQYLQGAFVFPDRPAPSNEKFPTRLVLCKSKKGDGCGLVQMSHAVDPDILYSSYWYRSGTNNTMRNHLKSIANKAKAILRRAGSITALDIGCNDGTLLKAYPEGTNRYGVDPSDIAKTIGEDVTVISGLFPSKEAETGLKGVKFDVITSIAMFYDLPDPVSFARAIEAFLQPDGIWIFEMSYLPLMLVQNSFDTVCHEHLEYYSLAVLEYIIQSAGLRAFRAELNDINGGSIRLYTCKKDVHRYDTVDGFYFLDALRAKERELELLEPHTYVRFQKRIEALRDELNSLLADIKTKGKTVHIYGASTKGNTLLQWYNIDNNIVPYAAERSPAKVGGHTLGTGVQMISEEQSREMKPDYYLVLPWHFKEEFLEREHSQLEAGTKFIFPLPTLSVYGPDGPIERDAWV